MRISDIVNITTELHYFHLYLQSLSFSRRVFATPFDLNSSNSLALRDLISLPFSALTFIFDVCCCLKLLCYIIEMDEIEGGRNNIATTVMVGEVSYCC